MYESYSVWIAALLLAGQQSTSDDGAFAVILSVALLLLISLWSSSRILRRARRVTVGHVAAASAAGCFSLGSLYTFPALVLAAVGSLVLEPAWKGESLSSRSVAFSCRAPFANDSVAHTLAQVGVAVDTQLLLLVAVSIEATQISEPLRIAAATVFGLGLISFIATGFLGKSASDRLRHGVRVGTLGLIGAAVEIREELTIPENVACTAALFWFILPPTS